MKVSFTTGTSNNVSYVYFITSVSQMACLGKILHELVERSNLLISLRQWHKLYSD